MLLLRSKSLFNYLALASLFSVFNAYSEDLDFNAAVEDCYKGSASECELAGAFLYKNKDYKKAEKDFKMACEGNNSKGCNELAHMYLEDVLGKASYSSAISFFEKGCALNYAGSCNNLGRIYESKKYGQYDLKKARASYEKACYMGESLACSNLGRILADPKNPDKNLRK